MSDLRIEFLGFPNMGDSADHEEALKELNEAGANGKERGWKFSRAWVYWRANGPAIPEELAFSFNKNLGYVVRVDGFAGGQKVEGPVGSYHIDTPFGLRSFLDLLHSMEGGVSGQS